MSEKSRFLAMQEAAQKARHLAPDPASVLTPDDLAELVKDYNLAEEKQKDRLTELLNYCVNGNAHRVEFNDGGDSWSNIQGADRFDIAVNRFVDRFIRYITKIE